MRLDALAAAVGAALDDAARHASREVGAVASLHSARPENVAALFSRRSRSAAQTTRAGAVITSPALATVLPDDCARLLVEDPRATWARALRLLHPSPCPAPPPTGIDPSATVDPSAEVAADARVGPHCVIGAGARVATGATLFPGALLGQRARVGAGATLLPYAMVLDDCEVGDRAWLGPGAVVGSPGFGLDADGRVPHLGRVVIGTAAGIGAHTCVDRGTLDPTRIGAGAQLDNLVQIGHNADIGDGAVLCGQVGVAGSARIGPGATLGGQAGVAGGVTVGGRARIAAQSGVTRDLPGGGEYSGHPAELNRPRLRRLGRLRRLAEGSPRAIEAASAQPTAQIHPTAQLAAGVTLGPGAIIGAHSRLGEGVRVAAYGVVGDHTTLGPRCQVHSFAVVGGPAQDRRNAPEAPHRLECGADNVFREGVTVSRGTAHGGGVTRLGARNLLMANCHVGHDATIGDDVTLANGVSLAGHVTVEDGVSLGGHAAVHQFVRLGRLSFIAANAMVSRDVPPFCLAAGDRAHLSGLNVTGLRRAGFTGEQRAAVKRALFDLLRGPKRHERLEHASMDPDARVRELARFIAESPRGCAPLARPRGSTRHRG